MEMGDATEYNFANKYVDGWAHWEILCNCSWFKPYITRWRRELELKIRSSALLQIEQISKDPSHKASFSANRFLLSGEWKDSPSRKGAGRPSKEEIRGYARTLAEEEKSLLEDYERIN